MSGTVDDHLSRLPILLTASFTAIIMGLVFLKTCGRLIIPVMILSCHLSLSSQPITFTIIQDQLPTHRVTSNGFFMAINFICCSMAAIGIGMLNDRLGLCQAFLWTAISGLIATPLVFLLPQDPCTTLQNQSSIIEE